MEKVPWSARKSIGSGAAGDSILQSIGLPTLPNTYLKIILIDTLLHAFLMRSCLTIPLPDSVVNVSTK